MNRRCPCGEMESYACARCGRPVCQDHWLLGALENAPCCFPLCEAPWWRTAFPAKDEYTVIDDDTRTKEHALSLLRRGAEPGAVAGELGISERKVRAWALALKHETKD